MGMTQNIGRLGEEAAAGFLLENGFELRHRNWRSGHHEIDIVATREGTLHIIEVKCRKTDGLTAPEDAMTRRKFGFLCSAARHYIAEYGLDMDVQFDLLAVEYTPGETHQIRYIPNVMVPRW